jgi:hypothetical protein
VRNEKTTAKATNVHPEMEDAIICPPIQPVTITEDRNRFSVPGGSMLVSILMESPAFVQSHNPDAQGGHRRTAN